MTERGNDGQDDDRRDDADEPAPVSVGGGRRPVFFMVLTCGFLACMCCVGGVFAAGALGFNRMKNLDEARQSIGAPAGWTTDDTSATPWHAQAELSGPADSQALAEWFTGFEAAASTTEIDDCLKAAESCTVEFDFGAFPVAVGYRGEGKTATATLTID